MIDGKTWSGKLHAEIRKSVLGNEEIIDFLLVALLANGHVLIEGLPGLAKTLLVKTLGGALGIGGGRVQFTPDLLPSDVVGTMIFSPKTGEFTAHKGPIFANLLLVDEINRAPAKVQSALLEGMQERQVTIGSHTYPLPRPFFVMATQNPIEQEGTYHLPEAQMDRFLFKLSLDYPSRETEIELTELWGQITKQPVVEAVSSGEELLELRKLVDQIYVSPQIKGYIVSLVRATREFANPPANEPKYLTWGASPRAVLALYQSSRAVAWLRGSDHVAPDHVQEVFIPSMRHRMGLTYEAEADKVTTEHVLKKILDKETLPEFGGRAA
jgi:MoxR-like ATPase